MNDEMLIQQLAQLAVAIRQLGMSLTPTFQEVVDRISETQNLYSAASRLSMMVGESPDEVIKWAKENTKNSDRTMLDLIEWRIQFLMHKPIDPDGEMLLDFPVRVVDGVQEPFLVSRYSGLKFRRLHGLE